MSLSLLLGPPTPQLTAGVDPVSLELTFPRQDSRRVWQVWAGECQQTRGS